MRKLLLYFLLFTSQVFSQDLGTLKILTGCYFSDSSISDRIIVTRCVKIDSFVIDENPATYIFPKPLEDFSLYLNKTKYDQIQMQFYFDYSWTSLLDFVIDENGNVNSLQISDSLVLHYNNEIIKKEFQKLKFTPCKYENKNVSVKAKLYITSYPQLKEYLPDDKMPEKDLNESDLISLNEPFIAEKNSTGNQRRKEARADILSGYILIIHGGMLEFINPEVNSIANTFGFHFVPRGCNAVIGDEYYNDEVVSYLNKINGKGWWKKFLQEVSKLKLKEPPSLPIINDN